MVKLLSGIVQPDSGTILLQGEPFSGSNPSAFQAQDFATVFQEVLIAPDRTVTDNILLGLDGLLRRTVPRNERRDRAAAALKRFAITDVPLDKPAGLLPLAAQQLVVLARAVVRNPKILILDEVTAALDFADRESVFSLMRTLAGEGCLILFITHRMDEVMSLSDRISILRGGTVVRTEERGAPVARQIGDAAGNGSAEPDDLVRRAGQGQLDRAAERRRQGKRHFSHAVGARQFRRTSW